MPGISKRSMVAEDDVLFGEEDIKQQRLEASIQKLSVASSNDKFNGRLHVPQQGHSCRSFTEQPSRPGGQWKGKGAKGHPYKGGWSKGNPKGGWKGASSSNWRPSGRGKGISQPPDQCHVWAGRGAAEQKM